MDTSIGRKKQAPERAKNMKIRNNDLGRFVYQVRCKAQGYKPMTIEVKASLFICSPKGWKAFRAARQEYRRALNVRKHVPIITEGLGIMSAGTNSLKKWGGVEGRQRVNINQVS